MANTHRIGSAVVRIPDLTALRVAEAIGSANRIMSTRACVAAKTPHGWKGVYNHFDGYPSGLGQAIWRIIRQQFINIKGPACEGTAPPKDAIRAFVAVYVDGHRGGWSVFGEVCYCHDPSFVLRDGVRESVFTNRTNGPLFMEFVYVLDPDAASMDILIGLAAARQSASPTPLRASSYANEWGAAALCGGVVYRHELLESVDLSANAPEPDWNALDRRAGERRDEARRAGSRPARQPTAAA